MIIHPMADCLRRGEPMTRFFNAATTTYADLADDVRALVDHLELQNCLLAAAHERCVERTIAKEPR